MAFEGIGLPADGAGKKLAARKATGQGPGGSDVYFEVLLVVPENPVGYVVASQPLGELPTTLTEVFGSTVFLERVFLANTNSTAITVQITDGSGTPIDLYPNGITIPGKGAWNLQLGYELLGGLKWKASTTGVNGAAVGFTAT